MVARLAKLEVSDVVVTGLAAAEGPTHVYSEIGRVAR